MNRNEFHKYFIEAIKSKLPPNVLVASYISKMLNVGKEASYRRIRGVVDFSFNEVVTISEDLNIPLFHLTRNNHEYIPFTSYLIKDNAAEDYKVNLSKVTDDFSSIIQEGNANVSFCYDSIPPELMFNYHSIMKMRWAKYISQYNETKSPILIDKVEIPRCVQTTFDRFNDVIKEFDMTLIIGEQIFQPTFKEIKYFASLNYFSKEFLHKVEEELNHFINELISYSLTGKNQMDKRFEIYLYHVYSTGSIVLAEGLNRKIAYLKTYGTNYFSTEDATICQAQANWVQNMKKNSTYITQSGEVVSAAFFREQKKLLSETIEESLSYLH